MLHINDVLKSEQEPLEMNFKNYNCEYVYSLENTTLMPIQSGAFLSFMQQCDRIMIVDYKIRLFKCDTTTQLIGLMSPERRTNLYNAIRLGKVKDIIHKQLLDRVFKLEYEKELKQYGMCNICNDWLSICLCKTKFNDNKTVECGSSCICDQCLCEGGDYCQCKLCK